VKDTSARQGREVSRTVATEARGLADTAREELARVRGQVGEQGRSLLEQTRAQLEDQACTGTERLAEGVRSVGDEAQALAEGRPDEAPRLQGYVRDAAGRLAATADRLQGVSDEIGNRGFEPVLADIQRFARRRPAAFLLAAGALGFAAGRLVRAGAGGTGGAEAEDGAEEEMEQLRTGNGSRARTRGRATR
jgi:hypothetical protein